MENKIFNEPCLETLKRMPDDFLDCVITSPPYWGLRDYGNADQYGLEKTPEEYTEKLVQVFRKIRRALNPEGTVWLNLGDSYFSSQSDKVTDSLRGIGSKHDFLKSTAVRPSLPPGAKPKNLVGIPWRVAFALQADGWYLRQDIIWHKPNPMPESVTDRCTKAHEYIFLLTKSRKYYFDAESIMEKSLNAGKIVTHNKTAFDNKKGYETHVKGDRLIKENRNKRSVWTVTTKPCRDAHFATFPQDLIEPMVSAGCPKGGLIYDPFMGAGTTAMVAYRLGRNYIGSEINENYIKIAQRRIRDSQKELF